VLKRASVIFLVALTAISLYVETLNQDAAISFKMFSVITAVIIGGYSLLDRRSEHPIFEKCFPVSLAALAIFAAQISL
jgi:hypothetical protein